MGDKSAGPGLQSVGTALSFAATMTADKGTQAGDEYQAAELDRAAEYGDLKAVQTGAQMTQRLNQTLGNIDVIRAASHDDPTSPTGAAYRDYQEDVGNTQRGIAVTNILAQSRQQEADAAYLRKAGNTALLAGSASAAGGLLSKYGPAATKTTFGIDGGKPGGFPGGSLGGSGDD